MFKESHSGGLNMKIDSLSVVASCAFGSFIGGIVALDINHFFPHAYGLWVIGALIGGASAYIAVDFKNFCAGVVSAYHRTIAWRPYGLYWRAWFANWVKIWCVIPTLVMLQILLLFCLTYLMDGTIDVDKVPPLLYVIVFAWATMSLTLGSVLSFAEVMRDTRVIKTDAEYAEYLRLKREKGYLYARNLNPFGAIFWTVYGVVWLIVHFPHVISLLLSSLWTLAKLGARFIREMFVLVHSSRRVLCFADATLGTTIGYALGSAIIGAFAGMLLGAINYELVSVRWLRLVPRSAR